MMIIIHLQVWSCANIVTSSQFRAVMQSPVLADPQNLIVQGLKSNWMGCWNIEIWRWCWCVNGLWKDIYLLNNHLLIFKWIHCTFWNKLLLTASILARLSETYASAPSLSYLEAERLAPSSPLPVFLQLFPSLILLPPSLLDLLSKCRQLNSYGPCDVGTGPRWVSLCPMTGPGARAPVTSHRMCRAPGWDQGSISDVSPMLTGG